MLIALSGATKTNILDTLIALKVHYKLMVVSVNLIKEQSIVFVDFCDNKEAFPSFEKELRDIYKYELTIVPLTESWGSRNLSLQCFMVDFSIASSFGLVQLMELITSLKEKCDYVAFNYIYKAHYQAKFYFSTNNSLDSFESHMKEQLVGKDIKLADERHMLLS